MKKTSASLLTVVPRSNRSARGINLVICAISFWHRLVWGEALSAEQPDLLVTNTTAGARGAISLRLENDAFAGTDEDYSNGISVSLLLRGRGLLGGFWDLFGKRDREYFQGYEAGQVIITPADTSLSIPDPNDRPYAGMLYVDIATAMRQANQFHGFKIVTGVVGPLFPCGGNPELVSRPHRQRPCSGLGLPAS